MLVDWQGSTLGMPAPALTLNEFKVPLMVSLWTDGSSRKVAINWGPISVLQRCEGRIINKLQEKPSQK